MKSLPTSYTAARKWGIILLLALASLGASLLCITLVSTTYPCSDIMAALIRGETQAYNIVVYARLPRTLAALLCGSALAVGGVILLVMAIVKKNKVDYEREEPAFEGVEEDALASAEA